MQSLKVRIPLKMKRNKNNLGIPKVSDALEIINKIINLAKMKNR